MTRGERKIRLTRMVEIDGAPIRRVVAAAAVRPVSALVNIVSPVAGITVVAAEVSEVTGAMTIPAARATVPAGQREARYRQMIERQHRPRRGTMAVCTLAAVAALVDVVHLMAAITRSANVAKIVTAMAVGTVRDNVSAGQWKGGCVVVEDCVTPVRYVVARFANIAKLPVMRIVRTMTAGAGSFGLPVDFTDFVAIGTGDGYVCAT